MSNEILKIAMLGHKRIPSREGGVEIVVRELAVRMAKKGHRVTCFNRRGYHIAGSCFNQKRLKMFQGVKLEEVFTINRRGLAAVSSSFFATMRATFGKYDVVHIHAEGPCAMMWLPKLFGKRCIATIHGLDWQREKWENSFASKYIKIGEQIAVRCADEIIVLSRNAQEYFQYTYGRKTVYIPNGVQKSNIREAKEITEKLNLHKDDYILYLGRIVPEKGLRYLIEAFKKIETDKKLVIAGGTSDTDEFFREIQRRSKEDSRIIFTNFVEGEILEELYSNAYIYVLPSDLEGMPLSLLEAMSYGNCCLVSDIRENVEVVEDKAEIFESGNKEDLREKLEGLLKNSEYVQRYKTGASEYICEKYNWRDIVEKTLALYEGKNEGINGK